MRELVRHELSVRRLQVKATEQLTPRMLRVTLTGDELEGFVSGAPDDHVKLFVPARAGHPLALPWVESGRLRFDDRRPRPVARDYTPVRFDAERAELDLEIVLHPDGHVTRWAQAARPGTEVGVAGPRGSHRVSQAPSGLLLAGDETALPAMRRWLRELPTTASVLVLAEVQDALERQPLETLANVDLRWLERGDGAPGTTDLLPDALRWTALPRSLSHAWLAGEAECVRRMRHHLCEERGVSAARVSARGYWKRGARDHQEPHED